MKSHHRMTKRHSSGQFSFEGINLNALSALDEITSPMNTPLPQNRYYGNRDKLLSLYGDNSREENMSQQHAKHLSMVSQEDRFIYYHVDTGCIKGKYLSDLKLPNMSLEDLLLKDNYWIDVTSPSNEEMKAISKVRSIFINI